MATEDEIGVLARTFNDMTGRLRLLYDDLKQEISERAEEEKRAGLEMLQAIMDNSPAVIYLKDVEGRYVLINRRYATLFNVDQENVIKFIGNQPEPRIVVGARIEDSESNRKARAAAARSVSPCR